MRNFPLERMSEELPKTKNSGVSFSFIKRESRISIFLGKLDQEDAVWDITRSHPAGLKRLIPGAMGRARVNIRIRGRDRQ